VNHQDHVFLLQKGVPGPGGTWADFGSGNGAFTLALADLLGSGGVIYSIDRDGRALRQQAQEMTRRFPGVTLHTRQADFTRPLDLPPLDGIAMANALHFVRDKRPVVALLGSYLKTDGRFLLVEYDTDRGNLWVPHPLSYPTWEQLAGESGFSQTERLTTVPSRFLGRIFSAASFQLTIVN
jgi:SAM-dependent methyltransferase